MSVVVIPTFRYRDAPAAIDWLCRAFGFERHAVYPDDEGGISHAQLTLHGVHVCMLGSVRDDAFGKFQQPPIGKVVSCSPYIVVDDPDPIYATALQAGAEVVMPNLDQDYGGRGFTVRDPEGHLWSFGSYRPETGAQ